MPDLRSKILTPWVVMPVVAVLAVGGWTVTQRDGDGTATVAVAGPAEQVVAATSGSMAQTVTAEGTVAAAETDDLSFTVSGAVTTVEVAAGDAVTAGQVLATIDSAELEAAVADAAATLADAEATLADDTDAGASDAQLEADATAVTTAEDRLASAQEDLAGAQLVASFDGTVASVDLTVGEELGSGGTSGTTATGSDSGSGQSSGSLGSETTGAAGPQATGSTGTTTTPQIQVVSTGRYTVELSVDDAEVTDLAVGQLATVTVSTSSSSSTGGFGGMPGGGFGPMAAGGGMPDVRVQALDGTDAADDETTGDVPAATAPAADATSTDQALVTEVGAVADASSGVASYPVTVLFEDATGGFVVGSTVRVDISYAEVADAVQVPTRAVTTTDGTSTVTVRTDAGDEERTVTTGLTADGMVQVIEGLAAGEQVVIAAPTGPMGGQR